MNRTAKFAVVLIFALLLVYACDASDDEETISPRFDDDDDGVGPTDTGDDDGGSGDDDSADDDDSSADDDDVGDDDDVVENWETMTPFKGSWDGTIDINWASKDKQQEDFNLLITNVLSGGSFSGLLAFISCKEDPECPDGVDFSGSANLDEDTIQFTWYFDNPVDGLTHKYRMTGTVEPAHIFGTFENKDPDQNLLSSGTWDVEKSSR
jgi:hypothetical protein